METIATTAGGLSTNALGGERLAVKRYSSGLRVPTSTATAKALPCWT